MTDTRINPQVESRPDALYTAAIQIMEDPEVRDVIDALRTELGMARSDLCRQALRAGLPVVVERLRAERDALTAAVATPIR